MKKWLILLGLIGLGAVAYYIARQQQYVPPWAEPKFAKVDRGDIRVPITAAGLINAYQVIEIKPEASGRILEVPVEEGTYVHDGDPLVKINPEDEQRLVDRAQAEFDRTQALLTQAQVAEERARANIATAQARLEELEAQAESAAFERQKMEKTLNSEGISPSYSQQEIIDIRVRDRISRAQVDQARIAVTTAELAQRDAAAAIKSQEAVVLSASKTLGDAQKRLRETTVKARAEGIVTEVLVRPGMLVQSAVENLMGGTLLMKLAVISRKKVVARLDEADYGRVLDISPPSALPDMPGLRAEADTQPALLAPRTGDVTITVDAFPDETFTGRIERIEPQGKLNQGSSIIQFDVHVELTDPRTHRLPLGAQAQVEFTVESAEGVLRVPAEAVKTKDDLRGVYVKAAPPPGEKHGKKFVPCRFGVSDGEFTELIAAIGDEKIKEGDEVYSRLPPTIEELRGE